LDIVFPPNPTSFLKTNNSDEVMMESQLNLAMTNLHLRHSLHLHLKVV
jgi:hypothetical protein